MSVSLGPAQMTRTVKTSSSSRTTFQFLPRLLPRWSRHRPFLLRTRSPKLPHTHFFSEDSGPTQAS